jgi:prepilin-type N-terminal cleavage/methylation domain-containing protein
MLILRKGFTLIELLVVVIIIGVLATMAFVSYSSADKQARDSQRKNDITQYRNLMQEYAVNNRNATYPAPAGCPPSCSRISITSTGLCRDLGIESSCLIDRSDGVDVYGSGDTLGYRYISNGASYVLSARLEAGPQAYWVACSNGRSGIATGPSNDPGICPLP